MTSPRTQKTPWLGAFGRRLFFSLALLSLLVAAAVGFLGYSQARRALRDEAANHMEAVARERRARLEAWFDERRGDMILLAGLIDREIVAGRADSVSLSALLTLQLKRQPAYQRFLYLDPSGSVSAEAGVARGQPFPNQWTATDARALASRNVTLGPLRLDGRGDAIMTISAPLKRGGEQRASVLALMRPGETLHPILADTTGLGISGETYLVGADTLMLTPSRHMNHPPALTHKMPTPGVLACLQGRSDVDIYRGYLGEEVLGAYQWLPRQRWALVAEIQTAEAFAPLRSIARQTILLGGLALLLALILSVTLSRRLSRPLVVLGHASERVAAGDLSPLPLLDGPGEIGLLGQRFHAMVSGLARSRRALESSSRRLAQVETLAAIGRLAAGLVHEMRNPLSAVKMNLSSLARSEALNEREREQLQIAREQSERLECMLAELLDYSRPVEPQLEFFSAGEVQAQVDRLTLPGRGRKGLSLRLEQTPAGLRFHGDGEMLVRALVNLVENAIQASSQDGVLRLAVRREGPRIVFEVEDFGTGMAPQVLEQLFDPFFTTREDGVGLGMSNVKKIVDLHGGELEIDSRLGEGTLVRILLPELGGEENNHA